MHECASCMVARLHVHTFDSAYIHNGVKVKGHHLETVLSELLKLSTFCYFYVIEITFLPRNGNCLTEK